MARGKRTPAWLASLGQRRCDHDPRAPRLEPRWHSNVSLPPLLEAIEGARASYVDRDRPGDRHHALLRRRRGRASKRREVKVQIFTVSRRRSDRAEAHALLLSFCFARCYLETLEVGQWQGGEVANYDLQRLGDATGLSPWRLDRAISDLVAAGYIYRHQPREFLDGDRWAGYVGRLKLTLAAFEACGVSRERLQVFRGKAELEAHKQRRREERRAPAPPVGTLISQLVDVAIQDLRPAGVKPGDEPAWNQLCWDVGREHPEWDVERVHREARWRLYGDPPPDRA